MQAAKLEVLIASAVICSGSMPSLLNPSKCLDSVASRWLVGREMGGSGYFREILVKYDYHLATWVLFGFVSLTKLAGCAEMGLFSGTTFRILSYTGSNPSHWRVPGFLGYVGFRKGRYGSNNNDQHH